MDAKNNAESYGIAIREHYPTIEDKDIRVLIDDLIKFAETEEKRNKAVASGQLLPRPDGNEYERIKKKFDTDTLCTLEAIATELRKLIEDLLAYTAKLVGKEEETPSKKP